MIPAGAGTALMPWREHQFRVKQFPDIVITFRVQHGQVTAMRKRDLKRGVPIFAAPRTGTPAKPLSCPPAVPAESRAAS
jgi:hypothetical protein